MRNREGRLNCSSTIDCSSPAPRLPLSRLLQCCCCRGSTACTGAAVTLKHQRDPMGTTWQPCTASKVSVEEEEEKGGCHFAHVSVKVLKAWTECFLCSNLFPFHSRYLSIRSLSGKRPTPRNPTENQMLTHQQKQLHFSLVYMSLSLGQLYVFPAVIVTWKWKKSIVQQ